MILTIPEIITLEQTGQWEQALQSITHALASHLFSAEEEVQLNAIRVRVLNAMPVKAKTVSVDKAFAWITDDSDVAAGLSVLGNVNLRLHTQAIQACFSHGISPLANAMLLQLCVEQHLTDTFTYVHPSGLICELIPAALTSALESELFEHGMAFMHTHFAHDNPSLLHLASQQFMIDVCLRFPIETDESEYDTIVLESIATTFSAMQDQAGWDAFIQKLPKK